MKQTHRERAGKKEGIQQTHPKITREANGLPAAMEAAAAEAATVAENKLWEWRDWAEKPWLLFKRSSRRATPAIAATPTTLSSLKEKEWMALFSQRLLVSASERRWEGKQALPAWKEEKNPPSGLERTRTCRILGLFESCFEFGFDSDKVLMSPDKLAAIHFYV